MTATQASALLSAPILPTLGRLALPNVLSVFAQTAVAITETFYMGQLGLAPLAAMALVFPIIMLQAMLSTGAMGGGVSSALSRALGANDLTSAQAIARHAVVIALCCGIAFTLCFELFSLPILALLGGSGAALNHAVIFFLLSRKLRIGRSLRLSQRRWPRMASRSRGQFRRPSGLEKDLHYDYDKPKHRPNGLTYRPSIRTTTSPHRQAARLHQFRQSSARG